ncbi:hypothetical protein Tco_0947254 [Tanacetum coccineum]
MKNATKEFVVRNERELDLRSGTTKNVEESEDKKSGKEDKQIECAELGSGTQKNVKDLRIRMKFYQVFNTKVKGCYGLADGSEGFPELIMKGDGSKRVDGINHMVSRPDHDGKTKLKRNMLPEIIFACCLPHNIVITMEGDGTSDN